MALEDLNVGAYANGMMDSLSNAAYPVVWITLVAVVVGTILWLVSHRHRVMIRILNSGGNGRPIVDRAREVKVDGVVFWKLLKRRHIIPVPPAEAITPIPGGGKPKFYVEMSWSEETGYVPLVYDVTTDNFKDRVVVTQHGRILKNAFQPLTPQQRSLFVNQIRKAESRRKKSVLDTIAQIATPLILVMLFVAVLIFWEDIAQPSKDMAVANLQMQQENAKTIDNIADISNQLARVANELTGSNLPVDQRPGAEGSS